MTEHLKLSRFNVLVGDPVNEKSSKRLFNTATGNYLVLPGDLEGVYERLRCGRAVRPEEAGLLYTAGFAVEENLDEVAAVQYAFEFSRKRRTSPHLTIAPTLACNFGCAYCFEDHVRGQMAPDIQDGLVRFVREILLDESNRSLSVSWFGGEPLMGFNVIRRLSKKFLEMVEEGTLSDYSANVITNGYLLKPELAREMADLGIRGLQITIDGPQKIHDQRRILKNKSSGTFGKIVENILRAPAELPIVLRVNVDRRNKDLIEELFIDLDRFGVLERVTVGIGKVEDFNGRSEPPSYVLSETEFADMEVELTGKARRNGWPLHISTPAPRIAGVCQVDSINSFLVTPTGDLMKCWAELGNNGHVVGHLSDPASWRRIRPTRLTSRDPFDDAECRSCPMLPTCMGSCPLLRQNNREKNLKVCPSFKYNHSEIIYAQFRDETRILKYIRSLE